MRDEVMMTLHVPSFENLELWDKIITIIIIITIDLASVHRRKGRADDSKLERHHWLKS
jgi:hypothetical protein